MFLVVMHTVHNDDEGAYMERITQGNVDGMFARFVRTAKTVGALAEEAEVRLDSGSRINGYQWRMWDTRTGSTILTPHDGLGFTKRECYNTLHSAVRALDMVVERTTDLGWLDRADLSRR